MNKKIFAAAVIALAGMFSTGVMAQDVATAQAPQAKECVKQRPNPFEGLNLTADQQAKLEALRGENKKADGAVGRQNGENKKAKGDKTDRSAKMEQAKKQRTEKLAKIKEILTPEQYVQFLENNFINGRGQNKCAQAKKNDGKKGKRSDNNGPRLRPDRRNQSQTPATQAQAQ